jgi:hypothetical protein
MLLKQLAPHLWSTGVLECWNETQQKLLKLKHLVVCSVTSQKVRVRLWLWQQASGQGEPLNFGLQCLKVAGWLGII